MEHEALAEAGACVTGVSGDDVESHRRFAGKHQLPYRLLSDRHGELRRRFGVPKTLGLLAGRVTYVIDAHSIVRVFNSQFRTRQHVEEGQGTVGYVTRDDCARASAAALLTATGTATFDITGPGLVGQADVATLLSALAGKPVVYVPIDIPALEAGMVQQGLPAPLATVLASIDAAIAAGTLSVVSPAVEQLTGVKPTSVADFFAAHAGTIRGRRG